MSIRASFLMTLTSVFVLLAVISNAQDKTAVTQNIYSDSAFLPPMLPSDFIQSGLNRIYHIEGRMRQDIDSSFLGKPLNKLKLHSEMLQKNLASGGENMALRSLYDIEMELEKLESEVKGYLNKVRKVNDEINSNILELNYVRSTHPRNKVFLDSTVKEIYREELMLLDSKRDGLAGTLHDQLKYFVTIESRLSILHDDIIYQINIARRLMEGKTDALFHKDRPAIWEITSASFPMSFPEMIKKTITQQFDTAKFYAEHALYRVIFFRVFLLLICLFPVWYFKKVYKAGTLEDQSLTHRYLQENPTKAALVMGLTLAPFIFIFAPHIFIEGIQIGLVITAVLMLGKKYPSLIKKYLYSITIIYVILKVLNFFVSFSMFERIFLTLSIILVIPAIRFIRLIPASNLNYKKTLRILIFFMTIQFVVGWVLVLLGVFTQGKAIMISSLDAFFLAIVLHIAVFTFLDYLIVLGDIINIRSKTFYIDVKILYDKLMPLLVLGAIFYWVVAFLMNTNSYEFIVNEFGSMMSAKRQLGSFTFSIGSFLTFLGVLYLSFYLTGLLQSIKPDPESLSKRSVKSSVGSFLVLMRIFLVGSGVLLALAASGIPMSDITILLGALGVGIGFGLQTIINNLFSGVLLAFEKPIGVNDLIEIDNYKGRVKDIGIRATVLDSNDGSEVILPNGHLISNVIRNWTLTSEEKKVIVPISIGHVENLSTVTKILEDLLDKSDYITKSRSCSVEFKDITNNAVILEVSFWVDKLNMAGTAHSRFLKDAFEKFKGHNIPMPVDELKIVQDK